MHSFLFLLQALLQHFRLCVACPDIVPSCDMLCTQEESTFRTADCKACNGEPQRECAMTLQDDSAAFDAWTIWCSTIFFPRGVRGSKGSADNMMYAFFACFSALLLSFLYFLFSFMCVLNPTWLLLQQRTLAIDQFTDQFTD